VHSEATCNHNIFLKANMSGVVDARGTHCHPESLLSAPWLLQQAELAAPYVELHCTSADERGSLFLLLPAVLQ
jgi:hypothetical protein